MSRVRPINISRPLLFAVVWLCCAAAFGQPAPLARPHIILPPSYGATAASTVIFAQASYVAAMGDFMESAAHARLTHAAAAEHEIRNALLWAETYFRRRRLNQAFRAEQNPGFLANEEERRKTARRRILNTPELPLEGDPTDELNWLLHELAGLPETKKLLPGRDCWARTAADRTLAPRVIHLVWLTDGGPEGKRLVFRADSAETLETTKWPGLLREDRFSEARRRFEAARDVALAEIDARQRLSRPTEQALMAAADGLWAVFNEVYPVRRDQAASPKHFFAYLEAERYLESLARAVFRLIESDDPRVFDGSFRFQGTTVIELINHLWDYGLEFAPRKAGGEGTYRKLFEDLRALYMALGAGEAPKK